MTDRSQDLQDELAELREEELVHLIRDTIVRLNLLGDRLERYTEVKQLPHVGFEVPPELDEDNGEEAGRQS